MQFEELPIDLKTRISQAKYYGSVEIRIVLDDALNNSDSVEEFQIEFRKRISALIDGIHDAVTDICGY